MSHPILRAAVAADLPKVQAIYAHAVLYGTASFELDPPSLAEIEARWTRIVEAGCPYLVTTIDGEVTGYAYASPYRPRPAYRFSVEDSVYVDPNWGGKGHGRVLLQGVINRAEASGFRQMVAVIGGSDHDASIGLHAALGFVQAGILRSVGWKHDDWRDTVLMQRTLGPGDAAAPT